ncbi:MAG: hypothetical protein ACLQJ0_21695 [Steroidobacteraceae bacterium]|jgi:hypothetical protein
MASPIAKFKITKGGEDAVLVFTLDPVPRWYLEAAVSWFPSNGSWYSFHNQNRIAGWNQFRLTDSGRNCVAEFRAPPYHVGDKFQAQLMKHWWIVQLDSGEYFDVEVTQGPVDKKFQIQETADLTGSVGVAQAEGAYLKILDVESNKYARYLYYAAGFGVSVPGGKVKVPKVGEVKVPGVPGSGTTSGPWNDFTAPGFLGPGDFEGNATIQTPANVGLGTSYSYNIFDLHATPDKFAVDVHIDGFSTGHTFSMPSSGFTSGHLKLMYDPSAEPAPFAGGRGGRAMR